MDAQEIEQPQNHQVVMNRFVAACQADERVVAAFLGGSYARDAADAYSDLDLYLITTDETYDDFTASCEAFIRRLGEPAFLEDYHGGGADFVFFTFPDGTEVELGLGRESHFTHIHGGPYRVLLDKKGILVGVVFPWYEAAQTEQIETLRGIIYWFWHDLCHHFITPLARGQMWSASHKRNASNSLLPCLRIALPTVPSTTGLARWSCQRESASTRPLEEPVCRLHEKSPHPLLILAVEG